MKERNYFCWLSQRVKNTRGATYAQHTRNLCAMLLAFILGIGQMWGAVYKTYGLSALTNNELTYEVTGLSGNDQKLNKGERKVEVPCASASGTLYFSGTGANADRYASIWGANGTAVDASRKVAMTSGYGSGIAFTSADILTEDGKYYIVFSNVGGADYKINAFKYTLSSACGGGTDPVPVSITSPAADPELAEIAFGETVKLSVTATGYPAPEYQWYRNTSASTTGATEITGANAASYTTPADLAVGTYYFYCVADNESGDPATSRFFPVKVNSLGADLTAHTPGVYEKAQASGGYGAALITYDEREYETYYLYAANSKLYMSAGNIKYDATGHKNLIDGKSYSNGVANVMDDSEDNWFSIAAQGYGNSKTPNSQQFNINTSGVTSANIRNTSKIRIKVSGYDNFSFMGNDNSSSNKFSVKIDGVTQVYTHNSSAMSIFSFDISTGEHYIEISSPQSSDSRFNAFSLRLPAVAKHHVTYAYGDAGASGTLPTQEDVKEGFTFEVASGAGLTPPNGKEFDKWNDGTNGYSAGAIYTMGTSDVTLTAVWKDHETSDDATLSDLTVGGETVTGFAAATDVYNVELPFGTSVVPTVAGTANSTFAKSVVVTPAASLPGSTKVVVTAENNSTKTYTINFTVASSKVIDLVWKTGQNACDGAGSQAAVIKSNDTKVSPYIKAITFENAEGTGDNAAEGGSLNTGKKAGNVIIIQTKPGYLFTAMSFFGKIEEADTKCQISIDGGANWSDLASTSGGDAKYCNVVSGASTSDIRIKGCGSAGTWIRNMQLTITTGCSPVTLAWAPAPATEVEVGKVASVSAVANYGTVGYVSNATDVIEVASDGALTVKALGSATITASVGGGDGTLYCSAAPSDINVTLNAYYLVEFDVQGGDAVLEDVKYFSGDAALTAPSAGSLSGFDFEGWFDAATGGNAIEWPLTPAASQKIYAHWTAQCAGPTITTQPVGANYLIGRDAATITCVAEAGNGGALTYAWYEADAVDAAGVALAGAPVISTAAAMDKYYYCIVTEEGCGVEVKSDVIHVVVAPKDGVSIIKVTAVGGKKGEVTGLFAGDGAVSLSSSNKMDGGKYIGFTLEGTTLQAGDRINVHTTTASTSGGSHIIFYDNMTDKNELYDTEEIGGVGNNIFTINAAMVGNATAYVYRSDADAVHKWNGYIDFIEVIRPMDPVLTAIKFNDTEVAVTGTTVAATLPHGTKLNTMTITPTIAWNGAGTAVAANAWEWNVANTYTVTDKDGDATVYTITLTEDVLKHTVSYYSYDGADLLGTEQVVDGGHPSAAGITAPNRLGYTFQGWAVTVGGGVEDLNDIAISADDELYAVYAAIDCSGTGVKFSMTPKANELASDYQLSGTDEVNIESIGDYATVSGGELYLNNNNSSNRLRILKETSAISFVGGDNGYIHVLLECPLKEHDIIRFENSERLIIANNVSKTNPVNIAKTEHEFVVPAAWEDKNEFFIWRSGTGMDISSIEVYRRPALTGASLANLTMRQGQNKTPELTLTPADALVTSQVWEITDRTNLPDATIDAATGAITTGMLDDSSINGTISVNVTLNGSIVATCTVTVVDAIVQADVTKSTIWDWHNTGAAANIQLTSSSDPKKNENFVLANVAVNNNANFESDKLVVEGEHMVRDIDKANPYFQGQLIQFHTTKAGVVRVKFSHTGSGKPARELFINGVGTGDTRTQATGEWSRYVEVPAGDVSLTAFHVNPADGAGQQYIRVFEIEFFETIDSRTGYAARELGTACYEYDALIIGAKAYEVAGVDAHGYMAFDEIPSGEIEAGKPYLFEAEGGKIYFCKQVDAAADPVGEEIANKGMYGTFTGTTLYQNAAQNYYYFSGRNIWKVNDFSVSIPIPAHRCYVDYDELLANPVSASSPAPGRRRITLGLNGKDAEQVATGIGNVQGDEVQSSKLLINGQLFILRGEKMYDASGRLVK